MHSDVDALVCMRKLIFRRPEGIISLLFSSPSYRPPLLDKLVQSINLMQNKWMLFTAVQDSEKHLSVGLLLGKYDRIWSYI
jgi:hypothetical protein